MLVQRNAYLLRHFRSILLLGRWEEVAEGNGGLNDLFLEQVLGFASSLDFANVDSALRDTSQFGSVAFHLLS